MLARKLRRLKQHHEALALKRVKMDRLLTQFEHSDEYGLDLEQMEKDLKLHKDCTASRCVVGSEHIESCQNENNTSDLDDQSNNPF